MSFTQLQFDPFAAIAQGCCPNCRRRKIVVGARSDRRNAAAVVGCNGCGWMLTKQPTPNAIETGVAGAGTAHIPQAVVLKLLDLRAKKDEYDALRLELIALLNRGCIVEPGMVEVVLQQFHRQPISWKFLGQHCDHQLVAGLRRLADTKCSTHVHIVPAPQPAPVQQPTWVSY